MYSIQIHAEIQQLNAPTFLQKSLEKLFITSFLLFIRSETTIKEHTNGYELK